MRNVCGKQRRSCLALAPLAVLLLAGCVDFDELVGADALDGAAADASERDLSVDLVDQGSESDAFEPPDAELVDADPGFFCDTQCLGPAGCFCADFDSVETPDEGFSEESAGGGTTRFFVEDARSPPRSVEMTVAGPDMAGEPSHVVYKRGFPTRLRGARLEFDWQLQSYSRAEPGNYEFPSITLGAGNRIVFGNFWLSEAESTWHVGIVRTGLLPPEDVVVNPIPPPPTGRGLWVHVTLEVRFAAEETGSVIVKWNDDEVLHLENISTSLPIPRPGESAILAASLGGGTSQGVTPDLWMLFDNIVLTALE